MGTDISIFAERFIDGAWQPWPEPRPNSWSKGKPAPVPVIEDMGRPYSLFTVLAGSGIGLRSRMGNVPGLPANRGLPPDMNKFYRRYFRLQPGDPSEENYYFWIMVSEIVNLDWDHQIVEEHAFVKEEYAELFGTDAPFPERFPSEASLYHGLFRNPPEGTVKVSWIVTLRNYVGCLDWFIPLLLDLGPPDEVRVIYSFDS